MTQIVSPALPVVTTSTRPAAKDAARQLAIFDNGAGVPTLQFSTGSVWVDLASGIADTVPASQVLSGVRGSFAADTTYLTADTSGAVDKGTPVRWSSELSTWVFDFYRSATVL